MRKPRVLVAGIGNIFFGDDGFGVEVVKLLQKRPQADGVKVVDFGIRGFDLALALEDCEAAVLIDATPRGGPPGTLYLLEPMLTSAVSPGLSPHHLTPEKVLALIPVERRPTLRILGCEPAQLGLEDDGLEGLSPAVYAVLDQAVYQVEALIRELIQ
jgi:hydrogenase maturation protease